jgi:cytosine deaminase
MNLPDRGVLRVGGTADLVIMEGRSFNEVLSRPQSRRMVLRAGRAIDTRPPDYAELDQLFR